MKPAMAHGSRICPYCGGLNGADAERCNRCDRKLPGALAGGLVDLYRSALGEEFQLTKLFIGLCGVVFVLTYLDASSYLPKADLGRALFMGAGLAMSTLLRFGALGNGIGLVEPWRLLSACFFHFGILHIGFNMVALWDVGRVIEQRVGSARFAITFVVTGIVGFAVGEAWYTLQGYYPPTAGASGAIFGLIGALIGYLYARRDPVWKQFLVRVAVYAVIFAMVLPVNNAAHFGGFASGVPLGYLFYKERRPWQRTRLLSWVAGALVAASVASVVLSIRSPYWQIRRRIEQAQQIG